MDTQRTNVLGKFQDIIGEDNAKHLETSLFNFITNYIDDKMLNKQYFLNFYMNRAFQLFCNMKEHSYIDNEHIQKLVKTNKINFSNLISMPVKNMRPKKWNKYKEDIDILNKEISNFDNTVTTTDQFTCEKCKQNKCYYTSFQLRSSDEPMTNFIVCINCGNNWREG